MQPRQSLLWTTEGRVRMGCRILYMDYAHHVGGFLVIDIITARRSFPSLIHFPLDVAVNRLEVKTC